MLLLFYVMLGLRYKFLLTVCCSYCRLCVCLGFAMCAFCGWAYYLFVWVTSDYGLMV